MKDNPRIVTLYLIIGIVVGVFATKLFMNFFAEEETSYVKPAISLVELIYDIEDLEHLAENMQLIKNGVSEEVFEKLNAYDKDILMSRYSQFGNREIRLNVLDVYDFKNEIHVLIELNSDVTMTEFKYLKIFFNDEGIVNKYVEYQLRDL